MNIGRRMRIYLSHSWRFRKTGKILQEKLEKLGFEVQNPFDYDQNKTAKDIVERDCRLIAKSDVVVVYYGTVSIGATMEIFWSYLQAKPVFMLCTPAKAEEAYDSTYGPDVHIEKLIEHPWLKHCVSKFFDNTRELLDYLEGFRDDKR